ncbi:hypothetical protein ACH6CV_01345 [Bacillota bacterium Meth-B3]
MKKAIQVLVLVLALLLAVAPACAAAEVKLANTVWQVKSPFVGVKGTSVVRFYTDKVVLKMGVGGILGDYTFDAKTGALAVKVMDSTEKDIDMGGLPIKVDVVAGMTISGLATIGKKGMTLSNLVLKQEIASVTPVTPKGLFDGTPLPFTIKATRLTPAVTKVSAKPVTQGTPSIVAIKANAAADCYLILDKDDQVIGGGLLIDGEAGFQHTFADKVNKISVRVGLIDQNYLLPIADSFSKPVKLTVKTK